MASTSFLVLLTLCISFVAVHGAYTLADTYQGDTFFNGWSWFTAGDPTHGYVRYVDQNTARSLGLVNTSSNGVYIGTDYKTVASGSGRNSVRLTSTKVYSSGLFIQDLSHMPTGCGTWPAWWLVGPNWPNEGEIDIIEGVNVGDTDQVTLHTNAGCSMAGQDASKYTGHLANANCEGNTGCGITTTSGTYGAAFNNHQGGVYAMEWTGDHIQTFYWARGNVPADVTSNNPNPGSWGKPFAYFGFGNGCPASHFREQQMVIDLTFCGDWAGAVFGGQCPGKGNCNDYVKNNPGAFKEAYWMIHYIKVFLNR